MKEIFQAIKGELIKGRPAVLATIVSHKGSTPRTTGTRMAVRADGSFSGTIGGGKLEADVLAEASKVFREEKNRIIGFTMQGKEAAQADMICGGELEVYLEYFSENNPARFMLIKNLLESLHKDCSVLLATLLTEGTPLQSEIENYLFVQEVGRKNPDNPWIRMLSNEIPEILDRGQPVMKTIWVQGEQKRVFLEPISCPPRLIIFGAGHVSAALCPLAKSIGFQVTVVDDRQEYADPLRFPLADELIVMPFQQSTEDLFFSPSDFVVIMTRGHLHDHQVLRRILFKPLMYLGMIGSRRKRVTIFQSLREEKVPEELIRNVHTPIGIEIGAETPEEIAVSITAELIQVRARKREEKKKITTTPPGP